MLFLPCSALTFMPHQSLIAVRPALVLLLPAVLMSAGPASQWAPADGSLLWSVPGSGSDVEVANSPLALTGDRVLLTYWRDAVMLKISRRTGGFAASELWRSTMPRGANGPTIYRDGFLYGFAGAQLVCLDAATGEARWRERTGEGTLVGLGPHLLFLGQTSGDLRASPDAFTEVLRTRVLTPETCAQ